MGSRKGLVLVRLQGHQSNVVLCGQAVVGDALGYGFEAVEVLVPASLVTRLNGGEITLQRVVRVAGGLVPGAPVAEGKDADEGFMSLQVPERRRGYRRQASALAILPSLATRALPEVAPVSFVPVLFSDGLYRT